MQYQDLAKLIYAVRTSNPPSRVLLADAKHGQDSAQPMGVLLLKPSSGYFPLSTVTEILERLIIRHQYVIRSAAWWSGEAIRAAKLMSLHYPGFHRVAHGGWEALTPSAKAELENCFGSGEAAAQFKIAYGSAFRKELVRTPYDLVQTGISSKRLNQLWEMDRSQEPLAVKRLHRLDEDTLCVALDLSAEPNLSPPPGTPVIVLNAFYAKLEQDFEENGCVALWIEKSPGSPTSWDALRSEYAGKTNPFQASPGTVRGDAARGLLPVETVSILANVLHLSATEAEGEREVRQVWWAPGRFASISK